MQALWAGSIGIIEEFFGGELVADDSRHTRRASVITPARIVGLPRQRQAALDSALTAHTKRPMVDYRRALESEPNGIRPTMLIAKEATGGYHTLKNGLRVVTYFGRVLVEDPLAKGTHFWIRLRRLHQVLAWLAEVRPIVAGGYITFFPPGLADRLRYADPAIAKDNAQRADRWEDARRRALDIFAAAGVHRDEALKQVLQLWDPQFDWILVKYARDREFFTKADQPWWDPVLGRLAASLSLGVDAMDTTADKFVLRYLGETLTAIPTRLASVQLPRLELLPPRELAALLSSDAVLAEVRSALDNALRSIPEGLACDPELAARWVDERLRRELRGRSAPAAALHPSAAGHGENRQRGRGCRRDRARGRADRQPGPRPRPGRGRGRR